MNFPDCAWYMFGTKGLKRGNKDVTYLSDQLIGLFIPGGRRPEAFKIDSSQFENNYREYNYLLNWISPPGTEILNACEEGEQYFHLRLPVIDVRRHVHQLLRDLSIVTMNDRSFAESTVELFEAEEMKILSENKNKDSIIILIFFSSVQCIKFYLKLLFQDIFCRLVFTITGSKSIQI